MLCVVYCKLHIQLANFDVLERTWVLLAVIVEWELLRNVSGKLRHQANALVQP